jgi:ATP-dependent Lon protease
VDEKVSSVFGQLSVDKGRVARSALGASGLPAFVVEWVVTSLAPGRGELSPDHIGKLAEAARLVPPRNAGSVYRDKLLRGERVDVIDLVEVDVVLGKHERRVASLQRSGLHDCDIADDVMNKYGRDLLSAGMWGRVRAEYIPSARPVILGFSPLQSRVNPDLYKEKRKEFTLEEWRDLLLVTCGWNPARYSPTAKTWLLARLIPLAQKNYHLVELAPKGTGKSYLFENLSHNVRLVSGGDITAPQLFVNNQSKRQGLLGRFDVVVFDELEQVRFRDEEEIVAGLKAYMANRQVSRGGSPAYTSDCSLVCLGNIRLNRDLLPAEQDFLQSASRYFRGPTSNALIDRLVGVVPGWEVPKFGHDCKADSVGLKIDFLAGALKGLRDDVTYEQFVKDRVRYGEAAGGLIRDYNAVMASAAGYLKLLFPDLRCGKDEFEEFCLRPAMRLRQHVRTILYAREEEYRQHPEILQYEVAGSFAPPRRVIEDYVILDTVGEGGMGKVMRAHARDGRLVAVKMSKGEPGRSDPNFRREIEVATKLFRQGELEHVIGIFGLIKIDGQDALVLEYADGGSLDDYLKRVREEDEQPLDARAVQEIATSILKGIQELHSCSESILHKDIKPSNVLRVQGKWKLADFGISRFDMRPPQPGTVTHGRTPDYSPPEQGVLTVDKTADLYAFAKTMLTVLTGSPSNPVPARLPQGFREVLTQCLERDRGARPRSADEVLARLNTCWDEFVWP